MDKREQALNEWLEETLLTKDLDVSLLVDDASFRRYFRVRLNHSQWIAMDAPPELEDSHSFVKVARGFTCLGIKVPEIIECDLEKGFLLLTDFGDRLFLNELNSKTADHLYKKAIDSLIQIQGCQRISGYSLPCFDFQYMMGELENFKVWVLQKYLNLDLTTQEAELIQNTFHDLLNKITEQPQCCIHLDYHSRNLMLLDDGEVGIIDFQDAKWGPVSYDLLSLLKDGYIDWPRKHVESWVAYYLQAAISSDVLPKGTSFEQFLDWFDLMGVQRHLKIIFIFARKYLRDNDDRYLQYIPRSVNYLQEAIPKFAFLSEFHQFFTDRMMPNFQELTGAL